MQPRAPISTDIVLLGAGHAHVEVLRRFAMRPEPGVRLTLIGREPETPYTGMLPGLIRGDYTFEQAHIDLAPLAASAAARLILAEATAIDLPARRLTVTGRPDIPFDLLSIDVGGEPAMPPDAGQPVKPIGQLLNRLAALEAELPPGARIAVVGGGAGGTELALALAHRYRDQARIVLVCDTPEPLTTAPAYARRITRAALVDANVELACGVRALGLCSWTSDAVRRQRSGDQRRTVGNRRGGTGTARRLRLGLRYGRLRPHCRHAAQRQPQLRLRRRRLRHNRGQCAPQSRRLGGAGRCPSRREPAARGARPAIAPLAPTEGCIGDPWPGRRPSACLAQWPRGLRQAGMALEGLDRSALDQNVSGADGAHASPRDAGDAMRCGGCGAKVGAEVLAGALAGLPRLPGADVLIGLDAPDDAAVMLPPPGMAVVQSVDHFRAFIDDPFVFGQIAAAHALSDLHAMGARPWTALAIAAVPYTTSDKMRTELADMLAGATDMLAEDGCALVGGHSAEAAEPALGFAVTGLANPTKLLRKSGLRSGDVLILTKPLGTGIVLAGHMRGLCRAAWLQAAIASMRTSNAAASQILRDFGAVACTDVTGFGLAGHLMEMLRASNVAATLWPDRVPALPGALELAAHGVESTLAVENRRVLDGYALLVDPQTSGGLLAGIAAELAEACVHELCTSGMHAAIIGDIIEGAPAIGLDSA